MAGTWRSNDWRSDDWELSSKGRQDQFGHVERTNVSHNHKLTLAMVGVVRSNWHSYMYPRWREIRIRRVYCMLPWHGNDILHREMDTRWTLLKRLEHERHRRRSSGEDEDDEEEGEEGEEGEAAKRIERASRIKRSGGETTIGQAGQARAGRVSCLDGSSIAKTISGGAPHYFLTWESGRRGKAMGWNL